LGQETLAIDARELARPEYAAAIALELMQPLQRCRKLFVQGSHCAHLEPK
jgi:hypothetical protein